MPNSRQQFLLRAMAVRDELKKQSDALAFQMSFGRQEVYRNSHADAVASLASLLVEFASEVMGDDQP